MDFFGDQTPAGGSDELDYYKILNICRDATPEQIKEGYKTLAPMANPRRKKIVRPVSPSLCGEEVKKFREQEENEDLLQFTIVSEAYEVLINPARKAIYDLHGERGLKEGVDCSTFGRVAPFEYHGDPYLTFRQFFNTDNPFKPLFESTCPPRDSIGGASGKGVTPRGRPVYHDLWLTLEEIYVGCMKKVLIRKAILSEFDEMHCPRMKEKMLTINVKPGTFAGTEYAFPREGDERPGAEPADIVFVVRERKHRTYERDREDLIYKVQVNLCDSLCGFTVPIITLDKRFFTVAVPHIIGHENVKIIQGEGFVRPDDSEQRGDLQIHFDLKYPNTLSQMQKQVVRKALECTSSDPDPKNNIYKRNVPYRI